jgi:regulatory protein
MPDRSAYLDALHMLARRELSVKQLHDRLIEREHESAEVERAIEHLVENGSVDDRRVARAYIQTALKVKGRGRLRIQRELQQIGIAREVATEAIAEAFGDVDERSLIKRALDKKLRGKKITNRAEYARVYQYLMRQGFSPATVTAVLRAQRRGVDPLE